MVSLVNFSSKRLLNPRVYILYHSSHSPKVLWTCAKSFIGFLNFRFLIKSSISCILIIKVQKVTKLGLGNQFGHGDAHFWTENPH